MSKSVAAGGAQVDGFIGDIITSILTEAQFQAQRNNGWVLMDGRNVGGSKYATTTGNNVIPDARGMFLRGKNNGRADGKQNPDGDVAVGTYQADMYTSHTHIQNAHAHPYTAAGAAGGWGSGLEAERPYASNTGATTATNQNSGGNETRSKNITVNYFIKIN